MKANELMIGDWVQFHHKGVKKISETPIRCKTVDVDYVGQIKGIYVDVNSEKGELAVKTLPNEYEKVIGLHMVRDFVVNSIPLTEEILEKNGFTCDANGMNDSDEPVVSVEYGKFQRNTDDGFEMLADGKAIKYVHELQHALRLCGVEKEIIL